MKEFIKIGQKFIDREKEYVRVDEQFREKLNSLQKKEKSQSKENQQEVVRHIYKQPLEIPQEQVESKSTR